MHVDAPKQSSSSGGDAVADSIEGVGADPDIENQFDLTVDGLENYRQSMIPGEENEGKEETAEEGDGSGGYDGEGSSVRFGDGSG